MMKMQKGFDADYERFVAGHNPSRKKPRYEAADERILNLVFNYNNANILEFLRGMSHNYHMD